MLGLPYAWDGGRDGFVTHGTMVAGLITAVTNNGVGVASLAPTAGVLSLRLKVSSVREGLPGTPGNSMFTGDSMVKAVRALRFQFAHGQWDDKVRVVNMSFGGDRIYEFWPPKSMKKNISRDLNKNDRLYVGAAGNDAGEKRVFPAAYSNVLGVSGLWTNYWGSTWYPYITYEGERYGSNYINDGYQTYPVSGIYDFFDGSRHMSTATPGITSALGGIDGDVLHGDGIIGDYYHINGTSAAAPQVSALAFHLYTARPSATYQEVWERIVSTRDHSLDQTDEHQIAGPADYDAALTGW
ncbi:S8 family serine peptidase [bacterium]|nr:S8 family serine peptidase [bacterium]